MSLSKAQRLSDNEWSNKYFAIAIGAMIVIYAVCHWSSVLYFSYGSRSTSSLWARISRFVNFAIELNLRVILIT